MSQAKASMEIDHKIRSLTCKASQLSSHTARLSATIAQLNHFFQGGLRWGELSEWGMPWENGCREVLLTFLQSAHRDQSHRPYWCLWVHDQKAINIYPPAWQARGIDLRYIRFASTSRPLKDLQQALSTAFFKVIVLDCVTSNLTPDDCCFLAQQARRHRQIIILLRNYFLSPKKGNAWAKTRVNCWHDPLQNIFYLKSVKGLAPRQIAFKIGRSYETSAAVSRTYSVQA